MIDCAPNLDALLPADLAKRLSGQHGLVFLDSALRVHGDQAESIIAIAPIEIATTWGDLARAWGRLAESGSGELDGRRGAAIGYVSYDGTPTFGIYPQIAVFDHETRRWSDPALVDAWMALPAKALQQGRLETDLTRNVSRERFCSAVARALEYIGAGDIYQVNLSHALRAGYSGNPFDLYTALRELSPAPYAAYLDLAGRTVLSASPELFLRMEGRQIVTRPIKGTRPRHGDPQADARSAAELLASPKEMAELLMITDLERNDLGKVCEYGSVRVAELFRLERFAQVFHLVATVEGRLRVNLSHADALRACFPGGSITGAPKRRAMEIIAELEEAPRNIYTGAIGYFGLDGSSSFSIAIRTAVIEEGQLSYRTGAGIVADSDPSAEDDETMFKASGILAAAKALGRR